ncbi:MAG: glycerol-3-phosphate 1-O-acyltransferase PlsY [Clostridiales bacterium]|jgi:glycerol-3-phosphate acyltransferase PlsY|nr:glycerol-3-phosphate 1-O-acyltransferase PlsY [Clostridiales bacterium]
MFRLICLCLGYALGCFQFAYILGRAFYKIDIREHGSGNAGATNAVRTMGARAGLAVFFLDLLKGAAGFLLASFIFKSGSAVTADISGLGLLPGLYAAAGVVLGHCFPFYMGFRGGKGIAACAGVIMFTDWRVALTAYALTLLVIAVTRYVSAGSLCLTLAVPALMIIWGYPAECTAVALVITAVAWFRHRGNISRLLKGEERKFNFRKDKRDKNG